MLRFCFNYVVVQLLIYINISEENLFFPTFLLATSN